MRDSGLAALTAVVLAGLSLVVGSGFLALGIWLAWPNGGESEYSTAANVGQLALVAVGLGLAGLAMRDAVEEERLARSLVFSVLALAVWLGWFVLLSAT